MSWLRTPSKVWGKSVVCSSFHGLITEMPLPDSRYSVLLHLILFGSYRRLCHISGQSPELCSQHHYTKSEGTTCTTQCLKGLSTFGLAPQSLLNFGSGATFKATAEKNAELDSCIKSYNEQHADEIWIFPRQGITDCLTLCNQIVQSHLKLDTTAECRCLPC